MNLVDEIYNAISSMVNIDTRFNDVLYLNLERDLYNLYGDKIYNMSCEIMRSKSKVIVESVYSNPLIISASSRFNLTKIIGDIEDDSIGFEIDIYEDKLKNTFDGFNEKDYKDTSVVAIQSDNNVEKMRRIYVEDDKTIYSKDLYNIALKQDGYDSYTVVDNLKLKEGNTSILKSIYDAVTNDNIVHIESGNSIYERHDNLNHYYDEDIKKTIELNKKSVKRLVKTK